MGFLISTAALADEISKNPDHLAVLDGSWHLPNSSQNAHATYLGGHIKGAHFFNIDAVCDETTDLPHMIPSAEVFSEYVSGLGIGNMSHVVVYDTMGLFSAARIWWMFRYFGHNDVRVLDGGLRKWLAESRPVESGHEVVEADGDFVARLRPELLSVKEDVLDAIACGRRIFDARSPARFSGSGSEPRTGLRSGHIPGSHNVYYETLLREDRTLHDVETLRSIFTSHGIGSRRDGERIIMSCGSGITAAILCLAMEEMGESLYSLYDGSWSEWGRDSSLPIETGPDDDVE